MGVQSYLLDTGCTIPQLMSCIMEVPPSLPLSLPPPLPPPPPLSLSLPISYLLDTGCTIPQLMSCIMEVPPSLPSLSPSPSPSPSPSVSFSPHLLPLRHGLHHPSTDELYHGGAHHESGPPQTNETFHEYQWDISGAHRQKSDLFSTIFGHQALAEHTLLRGGFPPRQNGRL